MFMEIRNAREGCKNALKTVRMKVEGDQEILLYQKSDVSILQIQEATGEQ